MLCGTTTPPTVIPGLESTCRLFEMAVEEHTSDHVTHEPLPVVPGDPTPEREDIQEIHADIAKRWSMFLEPLSRGGLCFKIGDGIGGANRESRLASCDRVGIGAKGVAIGLLDTQGFGDPVTDAFPARHGYPHRRVIRKGGGLRVVKRESKLKSKGYGAGNVKKGENLCNQGNGSF